MNWRTRPGRRSRCPTANFASLLSTMTISFLFQRKQRATVSSVWPSRMAITLNEFRRQELEELRRLDYRRSRIPALDALEVFVAAYAPPDPVVDEMTSRTGFSRWRPVEGGHSVLILYEGGGFDPMRFTLRKGAWNHEHCRRCVARIPAMELCWVSTEGFTILCESCHSLIAAGRDA